MIEFKRFLKVLPKILMNLGIVLFIYVMLLTLLTGLGGLSYFFVKFIWNILF